MIRRRLGPHDKKKREVRARSGCGLIFICAAKFSTGRAPSADDTLNAITRGVIFQ